MHLIKNVLLRKNVTFIEVIQLIRCSKGEILTYFRSYL